MLHVPPKMLQKAGDDQRAWLQFLEAKQCAQTRATRDAPTSQERALREEDHWHQEVYGVAAARISAILQDPDRYMKHQLSPVETQFKVRPERPHGEWMCCAPCCTKEVALGNTNGRSKARAFDVVCAGSMSKDARPMPKSLPSKVQCALVNVERPFSSSWMR